MDRTRRVDAPVIHEQSHHQIHHAYRVLIVDGIVRDGLPDDDRSDHFHAATVNVILRLRPGANLRQRLRHVLRLVDLECADSR